MEKLLFSAFWLLVFSTHSIAQNPFVGTFQGIYNGDNIVLSLQNPSGNILTGKMTDSKQNYDVTATNTGAIIQGKAIEKTLNFTFVLNGVLKDNQLAMHMVLEYNGQKSQLNVVFYKQASSTVASTTPKPITNTTKIQLPSGAQHDPNLVGMWAKNDTYSSGYGDNAMGGSFEQSMIFFADGTVGDGGSRASVSGSNYSGYSEGGGQALAGVYWYNIENQLYLYASKDGQTENLHLGKYYIENRAMLITGTNGKKQLFTKK